MKWRKQNKIPNRNNKTLDSFINGLTTDQDNSSKSNSKVTPKIKVPPSSGLQPIRKPVLGPFLYPEFPQFRQYQYSIAIKCITQNTMVCLPTGLGKTHIASVLILNFHLWFPENLIFFLAPTKPLVDQQSMTLSNFSQYIPPSCIFSLTGSTLAPKRVKAYEKKKILFCTPQTLQNDLREKRLDPKNIILIIFDQAHKAVGNYSYANITRMLDKEQFGYRVIGLSATPGNDHDRIQEVLQNLQICNMIVKSDEDQDVKKYIKKKNIQPIIIQNTSIIKQVQQTLQQYISWPLRQLLKLRLFDKHLANGKYGFNPKCFFAINSQINQRLSSIPFKFVGAVQSAKMFLKFLSDSLSLLRQSGYQSFKKKFVYSIDASDPEDTFMQKIMAEKFTNEKIFEQIRKHPGYKRIKQLFSGQTNAVSHPKLQKLRDLLYTFLSKKESIEKKSKVIIFANLRFTCHQIHKYLSQVPFCQIIKSQIFLGQAKTTVQTREGENSITETLCLSQKDQINLIKRYKANQINTLVSTSIGEEGLDIGQVDAIFCYEGGMSTIRMIQRMGRTGRKRDGSVYVLLMEGKQLQDYEKATKKTAKMKKTNNQKYKYYSYNPVLFEEFSEIPIQFIKKPIEQTISKQKFDDDFKQVETKKKKNKLGKEDKKKTKKKVIQQETKIQQASFSQQNEPVTAKNQENEQGQQKERKYQKYFKIKGQNYPQIPNQFIESQPEKKIEELTESIDHYYEPEQYTNYTNYSSDQDYSSCSSDKQSYMLDLKPMSGQFAKLFDFQTLYQDQQHKNEEQQPELIDSKIKGEALEENERTKDQINESPKEIFHHRSDSEQDSEQQLFKQYQRLKEKQNKEKLSQQHKKSAEKCNEVLDCSSQDSSQIIDKHQLDCFSSDKMKDTEGQN